MNKKKYVDVSFSLLFQINNMYTFLHKKKINFLSNNFFKFCQMYAFDQYVWLEITITQTTKQWIMFFINQFTTFCVNFLCNDILFMLKTYRPSIFSVMLQLEDLISENMKMSKLSQNCWQRWFNIIFRKKLNSALNFLQYM